LQDRLEARDFAATISTEPAQDTPARRGSRWMLMPTLGAYRDKVAFHRVDQLRPPDEAAST
jgi:hypothetical protein